MKELQYILNKYLLNKGKQKKYLAFVLALSMFVSFAVPLSLIQPADSMTIQTSPLADRLAGATPGVPSVLEGTNMLDITSADEWLANISSGDNYFYDATQDGVRENKTFSTAVDPLELGFYIEYNFKTGVSEFLNGTGPHLAWDLGNPTLNASFPNGAQSGAVDDYDYFNKTGKGAGTFKVENGVVKITLEQDYIDYVNKGTGELKGSLQFSGELSRSQSETGDQTFTMAGQTVIVDFPDQNAKPTNKTANVNSSNGTIEWTVTIDNSNRVDMTGYILEDKMLKDATSVTFTPSDPVVGTHNKTDGTISFTDATKNAPAIVIKYVTPITEEQLKKVEGSATNTATLKKGDSNFGTVTDTADFNKKPIIVSKNGTADYESGSYNRKIDWTVEVKHDYGLSLDGYVIEDPKLPEGAQVSNGTLTHLGGNKWQLNTTASSVKITYTTDAEEGTNSNSVKVYYDKDETDPVRDGTTNKDVTYNKISDLITLDKTSSTGTDGTIEWKINVSNSKHLNLAGYTLTDQMLSSATEVNIPTVWVNNANTPVATFDKASGTITFTEASQNSDWISITYKTDITREQLQGVENAGKNEVALRDNPNAPPIHTDIEEAKFDKDSFTVTKKANADYETGDYGGKINWTITINNPYGVSMDGYLIDDTEIPGTTGTSYPVSPSGTLTKDSNGKWMLSGTKGAKTLTFTYQTDAEIGKENPNTAALYYPDNQTKADDGSDSITYKSESELVSIDKTGWYNQDTHEINWTININVQGGLSLDDYEVTDAEFPSSLDEITFNPSSAKNYATLTDGKITFGDYQGSVSLSYKTKVDLSGKTGTYKESNDVGIGNGTNNKTTTGYADVTVRKDMQKKSNQWSTSITNNKEHTRALSWTADITLDDKFAGETYVDTLKQPTNGLHIITDAQLNAIQITARKEQYGASTTLTLGTDFTAKSNDGGKNFTITFNDTLDAAGYNFLTINYNTTATAYAPASDASYPITYVFGNSATFNEITDNDNDWTLTRNNPEKNDTLNLTVEKQWSNDTENTRPNNITTRILYYTSADATLRALRVTSDGKYLYYGDEGYDAATEEIVLNSAGGWKQTFNNLRKEIVKADENGNPGTSLFYYYKVEEIKVNGQNLENGLYEVADGYYQVGYNNNNGNNYTSTIWITNNFNRNTQVTPKKLWTGDAGTGTGFNSVTVQLEYSTDGGGTRCPVKILNDEYIFDANGTTAGAEIAVQELTAENSWVGTQWTNLPSIIVVNGAAVSCKYFIRETAVTEAPAEEGTVGAVIPITGTRFVTSDGYYNVYNSAGDGSLTVTNEFKKNTTYTIGATKAWTGDVYNTDSRPAVVLVQLQQSANWGAWMPYGDPHTVELSAGNANGWTCSFDNLPNQEVAADGTVTTYRYRIMEVGYKMTTDSDPVMFEKEIYSFATDESGYYNIVYSSTELSQSGTVNITNNFVPVPTLTLTPQKKWMGDADFASTNRPKSVTFTLQRRLGYSGTWENVVDNGNIVTVTLQDDENATTKTETVWNASTYQNEEVLVTYWNSDALPNLPAKVIKRNPDGSYTEDNCQYRFVETSYVSANGTTTTIPVGATEFKTEDGKYIFTIPEMSQTGTVQVTNTFEESIGISKSIVTSNGPLPATLDRENLEQYKYEINGEFFYVFNWLLEFDASKDALIRPLSDRLPEGFELCIDTTYDDQKIVPDNSTNSTEYTALTTKYKGYFEHPTFIWPGQFANGGKEVGTVGEIWSSSKNGSKFYYDEASNTVYFNRPYIWSPMYIGYATKIKCDVLDAMVEESSYTITNNAIKHEDDGKGTPTDETASASLKIINPIDTNLITKSYSETRIPGSVQYSLNINPEGKNLSTGDTIDIQDLFETVSYLDHDYNGGETTTGKKLVDVLMSNIKLYEVDANGNKIELNSSDYTLMFQTGSDVSDGAALMKLTIPDEKHIVVDYTYKLIANASTPSVIHGCKSSTRVNGRYVPMAPGLVPPAGDTITFSNTASLKSDSAESSDSKVNTSYEIAESSGTISTNALPSIKKVNTGDYSINNLEATFLMARYENGKWHYVDYAELVNAKKGEYDITWSPTGTDGTRITDDAVQIKIEAGSDVRVPLEQDVLYKLVEIVVPEDYEGSNLFEDETAFEDMIRAYLNDGATYYNGKDYSIFLNHYISTHYFTYNSTVNTYPDGVASSDVIQVKSGDDVEIPNNKLIDIDVKKQWVNPVTAIRDSKITVELYWSYTKGSTGIPTDAVLATAEDLGIMDEAFSATKTITVTDEAAEDVWKDLPNGIGRRPIYYYIKEVAYEINGTVYELDDDGSYKAETGEVGAYMPTYSGNAANDDAVIDVRNSSQLMLKKEWKNSANVPMQNIPTNGVVVSIYGIYEENGVNVQTENPLFEGVELSVANNWTADITSLLTPEIDLSEYKAFVAVENENPDLEGYVVSCVFNLNAQTGEIIVTNKNTAATEASVTVNKLWSDGETLHANESIEVTLWRSKRDLTDLTDLASKLSLMMSAGDTEIMTDADGREFQVTLNAENGWTYTWTGLPLEDENMNKYYYYVLENMSGVQDADKYDETYIVTNKTPTKTEYTVKNYRNAIRVEKVWKGEGNTELTNEQLAALNMESITLDVMREVLEVPEDGLDIVALGDSITRGEYQGYVSAANTYPPQMEALLESDTYAYSDVRVIKQGQDTTQIPNFESRLGDINSNTEIVCIIGGTNDIHQDGSKTAITEIRDRMSSLIGKIKAKNSNIVILVGSIPHFDFVHNNKNTDAAAWWGEYYSNNSSMTALQTYENKCNARIDAYNLLLEELAASLDKVYYVDICSAVNKDTMLYVKSDGQGDGCHPNETGYKAIASTFAAKIDSLYGASPNVAQVTLSPENNWTAAVDIDSTDKTIKYYVNELNLPAGWTVEYTNNNQLAGSSTPITVTNTKHTPLTDLTVEKIWQNDEGNDDQRANMRFDLLRSTDKVTWEEAEGVTPTLVMDGDTWTYRYEDLPAEDSTGKTYYYMVEETPPDGYVVTYGEQPVTAVPDGETDKLQMTNTFKPISLNVVKSWEIPEGLTYIGIPDDAITVQLQQSTDGGNTWTDVTGQTIVLEKVNNWTGQFADIPGKIGTIYRVREEDVPSGWSVKGSTTASEDGETITITNTLKIGDLNVQKDWADGSDDPDLPGEIKVAVYRRVKQTNPSANALNTIAAASEQRAQAIQGVSLVGSDVKAKAEPTVTDTPAQGCVIVSGIGFDQQVVTSSECDKKTIIAFELEFVTAPTAKNYEVSYGPYGGRVSGNNTGEIRGNVVVITSSVDSPTWIQVYDYTGSGIALKEVRLRYSEAPVTPPLTLTPEEYSLKIGDTVDLKLEVEDDDSNITWSATFSNGDDAVGNAVRISNASKTGATITALQAGTVTVTATDGTNSATATITVLPMEFKNEISMTAGDKLTLSASNFNNFPATCETIDYECSAVDADGNLNNVTETTEYTLTAIAKDENGTEITRTSTKLTVSPFTISPTTVQLAEGENATLEVKTASTWTVQEGFEEYVDLTPSSDGTKCTVTYKKYTGEKFTVTATHNTVSASAEIEMQAGALNFTSKDGYTQVHVGGTIQLTVTEGAVISGYDESIVTFDENALTVTGKATGTTTFTASRNGNTQTLDITVIDSLEISGDKREINTGETLTLRASNKIGTLTWTSTNNSIARVDENGVVTGVLNGTVTIIATDVDGVQANYTVKVNLTAADANVPEDAGDWFAQLTLNADGDWKAALEGLPLTDGLGNVYEYYIVELDKDGNPIEGGSMTGITGSDASVGYIPVNYENNGTELTENGDVIITVTNKKIDNMAQGSMPSTGGTGTQWYYIIGMMTMLMGTAGFIGLKLRQRSRG